MKKLLVLLFFLSAINLAGCKSSASEAERLNEVSTPAKPAELKTNDKQNSELRNQIEKIAQAAKGRVGASATVLESGDSISFNGQEHFPMQSVYKFPIAMAVLKQVDEGNLKLEQKIRVEKSDMVGKNQRSPIRDENPEGAELTVSELLRFMVSESDGTACDVLLKTLGGAENVGKYLSEINISDIIVANTEKEIGSDNEVQYRNWATPDAAVNLLRAFHEGKGFSKESRALLLKLMTDTPTGMKRLKGQLPAGTVVAHKTGTSGTVNKITAATNDIGLITLPDGRHLAIAVFVSDSPADEKTREEVIARIARAVWDKWNK